MDTGDRLSERDRTSAPGRKERSRFAVLRARYARGRGSRRREAAWVAVLCLTGLAVVNGFVAQPFLVPSGSMDNTLRVGDRILVNKLAYRFGNQVRRGDVVVFDGTGSFVQEGEFPRPNPVAELFRKGAGLVGFARPGETDYTKRVIGIAGDRVTCCDKRGRIEVNGVAVDERGNLYPGDAASGVPFDIVVPEGKLFVLGDHRSRSRDSRDHLGEPGGGMVPVGKVIGRADWIVWPLGRTGELKRPPGYTRVPDGAHG
ncbi:signal peptidase I [Wenjunlia tyrosinilytica]|nr:signal peptidase I [Wenjunlia tyrosinilytica]